MVQTLLVVCAVFFLMYTAGEDDLEDVSLQLRAELSERIRQKVDSYVDGPETLNRLNIDLFMTGQLPLDDHRPATRLFWKQMSVYSNVAYISVGTREGDFFGIKRMKDGRLQLRIRNAQTGGALEYWRLDENGEPVERAGSKADYDPRKRPWYQTAAGYTSTEWSEIASYYSTPNELAVGPLTPIRRNGELLGVLTTDLRLGQLSDYLQTLPIGKNGIAVVISGDGTLVGSSTSASITKGSGNETTPMHARESEDPRIRTAIERVSAYLQGQTRIGRPLHFVEDPDTGALVTAVPLGRGMGLDWVVLISVPSEDVMGRIRAGRQRTFLLCLVALAMALLLALSISRSITQPLSALTRWARRVSEGSLEQQEPPGGGREIDSLARSMNEMVDGLRDRDFIHDAFGRYVSPDIMAKFMGDSQALHLGGQCQEVTIMMSDMRGFTGLSERLTPEEMVQLLNRYLGRMTDVILGHQGTIVEFIGDAILVLFGAPVPGHDDAVRAVRCAIDMQRAMVFFNAENEEEEIPVLEMGIAINTGEVVAGNIGSERHVKYGVVGEPVNLTARLESLSLGGEVLISAATYAQVKALVDVESTRSVRVKGISDSVTVYGIIGMRDDPECRLPDWGEDLFMETDLVGELYHIENFIISETPQRVRIVRLGERQVDILSDSPLEPNDKYKLRMQLPGGHWTTATYADVTQETGPPVSAAPGRRTTRLGFASVMHTDRLAMNDFRALMIPSRTTSEDDS